MSEYIDREGHKLIPHKDYKVLLDNFHNLKEMFDKKSEYAHELVEKVEELKSFEQSLKDMHDMFMRTMDKVFQHHGSVRSSMPVDALDYYNNERRRLIDVQAELTASAANKLTTSELNALIKSAKEGKL